MTPLSSLLRAEIHALCQEADGQWRTDAPPDRALLCGSFNPLHRAHLRLAEVSARRLGCPVAFELSVANADKAPLPHDEIGRRLRQFHWLGRVWVTPAATFVEKARLFPGTTWIVGFDTAERILQPRFYGNDEVRRSAALQEIRDLQCRFLVAGRADHTGEFRSAEALDIPPELRSLFEPIPEADFRLDLSSTELRARTVLST